MKYYLKKTLGVAVATAMTLGAVGAAQAAPTLSVNNKGDAAIVPYYTTNADYVSGIHITNTTMSTQVVKVRYHRGMDSMDALDFILVLSPKDEFTGSIGVNAAGNLAFRPSDKSCTVPQKGADGFLAPQVAVKGGSDGYITVIGMGETEDETQQLAIDAVHHQTPIINNLGEPIDGCERVQRHFAAATTDPLVAVNSNANTGVPIVGLDFATDPTTITDANTLNDVGVVSHADTAIVVGTDPQTGKTVHAISKFKDTNDEALSVTYFIRDQSSGLEFGNSAVHIKGFADGAMLANQEYSVFDPLCQANPNIQGALSKQQCLTGFDFPNLEGGSSSNGGAIGKLDPLRGILQTLTVSGDWANTSTTNATTDWVVTFIGQNLMPVANRDIPIGAAVNVWDREEGQAPRLGLVVSPNTGEAHTAALKNEVNVVTWNGGDALKSSLNGNRVDINASGPNQATFKANRGIADLVFISGKPGNAVYDLGSGTTVPNPLLNTFATGGAPTVGITAWRRNFADVNRHYGRIVGLLFNRGQ